MSEISFKVNRPSPEQQEVVFAKVARAVNAIESGKLNPQEVNILINEIRSMGYPDATRAVEQALETYTL